MRLLAATFLILGFVSIALAAEVGEDAPSLDRPTVIKVGQNYQHGPNINIDDLLGKAVVVNFWASW